MDRRQFILAAATAPLWPEGLTEDWKALARKHASDPQLFETLLVEEPNALGVVLDWAIRKDLWDLVSLTKHARAITLQQEMDWVARLVGERAPQLKDGDVIMLPAETAARTGNLTLFKELESRGDVDYDQCMVEACACPSYAVAHYIFGLSKPGVDANTGSAAYLRMAAQVGDMWGIRDVSDGSRIVKMLLEAGANPNAPNPINPKSYALARASHWGNYDSAEALLIAGADPNIADGEPIKQAAGTGYPKIIQLLVRHGARKPEVALLRKLVNLNRRGSLSAILEAFQYTDEELGPELAAGVQSVLDKTWKFPGIPDDQLDELKSELKALHPEVL